MKAIFLVFAGLIFFSCKKDDLRINPEIYGIWEFEHNAGYPFTNPVYPPGNGQIIVLSRNGRFERRQHDTVLFKGRFFLKEKEDCYLRERKIFFITNDPGYQPDMSIDIYAGKLALTTSNCYADGGISYYRRVQVSPDTP